MQHKRHNLAKHIELKEGHGRRLCCNKANGPCPSLSCKPKFSKEAIDNLIEFGRILKEIHIHLLMQGWKIEPGKFTKPDGTIIYVKNKPTKN